MESKVFFTKVTTNNLADRVMGLKKILEILRPELVYEEGEYVPVKLTIGDSQCIYNVNAELVKTTVTMLKSKGARPFLFDTNVIYEGQRQNAVDHLTLVQNKGFGFNRVGAPFIVGDGVFGLDGREFPIEGRYMHRLKVPSFVGMVDSLVVLTHATGHIVSGYAGAIKNVAMGMACRPTKQVQHSALKPMIIEKKCTCCGCCLEICPARAIIVRENKAFIVAAQCIGCGECLCACKFKAVLINWEEDSLVFVRRMAETAHYILAQFKKKVFVNFAFDITKECDCISTKNEKMVAGNIGILASTDIVSIDRATADLSCKCRETDFLETTKNIYDTMLSHSAELGTGSLDYELVEV